MQRAYRVKSWFHNFTSGCPDQNFPTSGPPSIDIFPALLYVEENIRLIFHYSSTAILYMTSWQIYSGLSGEVIMFLSVARAQNKYLYCLFEINSCKRLVLLLWEVSFSSEGKKKNLHWASDSHYLPDTTLRATYPLIRVNFTPYWGDQLIPSGQKQERCVYLYNLSVLL